jgi:hypothetical protein
MLLGEQPKCLDDLQIAIEHDRVLRTQRAIDAASMSASLKSAIVDRKSPSACLWFGRAGISPFVRRIMRFPSWPAHGILSVDICGDPRVDPLSAESGAVLVQLVDDADLGVQKVAVRSASDTMSDALRSRVSVVRESLSAAAAAKPKAAKAAKARKKVTKKATKKTVKKASKSKKK